MALVTRNEPFLHRQREERNSDGFLWSIQEQEDSIGRRILTWSKEIKGPLPRYHLYRILQNSLYSHDSIRVYLLFFIDFPFFGSDWNNGEV